ncbi:peroxide stress protein YaaA [Sphingomonas gilva]|uniref:UPF0246 protein D1610_16710 n=1 Tax=Sphingomonas gilva TaxID=2305907 RepID=A0A396RM95_9SPHN|nr:peroxide stress protein YaaA [Sphingomonas gilva]RHW16252.1 peroxide stress protein YaaA [Sphingomonas gilva]
MIALLSPAKTLDYAKPLPELQATTPRFESEATLLADAAAGLGVQRLMDLMDISPALASLNAERFGNFPALPVRPALFAFAGDVYTGFDARSAEPEAIDFAQDHVRILSGLYGLLRPLDEIRPYRLEMGTRWAPHTGDLYGFWQDRIARLLAEDAVAEGSRIVIDLASREYWRAVEGKLPEGLRVIRIDFRERAPGGLKFNSFAAKRARGAMARYICEHRLDDPEALKGFDQDGYAFDAAGSEPDMWLFVRA